MSHLLTPMSEPAAKPSISLPEALESVKEALDAKLAPAATVAVALSGGVDSAMAAFLLKKLGFRPVALHMNLVSSEPGVDFEQLQGLSRKLDIPLHLVDLRRPFQHFVVEPFLEAYRRGMTPNPCVLCNPIIKFSFLLRQAEELGAERLVTGHYVRLTRDPGSNRILLRRGRDRRKDQSYFLYGLSQDQLAKALFPMGYLCKHQVKALALEAGLADLHRPESQEICFIPKNDYRGFLKERVGAALPTGGPIVDLGGRIVGEHRGIHQFTIGQRRGLNISSSAPYYVVALEPDTCTVRVGRKKDLLRRAMRVSSVNWVSIPPPASSRKAQVQIRYRHRQAEASIEPRPQGVLVHFLEPQAAITPGQSAVFYQDDLLLGGGIIEQVFS
ncbi:MAG: tRNA 2-thiouridine(34) synthase MnmA [Deltaproteobacteria bacterium]|nr:tRNA 2-thiouridine(34) synthase MnmA [Deltaproteobacteria bacterium]